MNSPRVLSTVAAAMLAASAIPAFAMEDVPAPLPADRAIPNFNAQYYLSKYPDLQRAIGNNPAALLDHFRKHGQNELRAPSRDGDASVTPYAKWAEGCKKGQWGGIARIVTKGKGGRQIGDRIDNYCDEWVYRYAKGYDDFNAPPRSGHGKSFMRAGDWIREGEYMVSEGAQFIAAMQPDGNFCIYQGSSPAKIHGSNKWCSLQGRASPGNPGKYFAILQNDANFCVYKGTGPADNKGLVSCVTKTSHNPNPPYYYLALQNDANLVVYKGSSPSNRFETAAMWDRITTAPPKPDTFWESTYKGLNTVGEKMVEFEKMKAGGK